MWTQWVNSILGLAIIAIAFLGLSAATLMWTLVVVGAVVAILGFWGGAMNYSDEEVVITRSSRRDPVYM